MDAGSVAGLFGLPVTGLLGVVLLIWWWIDHNYTRRAEALGVVTASDHPLPAEGGALVEAREAECFERARQDQLQSVLGACTPRASEEAEPRSEKVVAVSSGADELVDDLGGWAAVVEPPGGVGVQLDSESLVGVEGAARH